jgi:hypothetical protein
VSAGEPGSRDSGSLLRLLTGSVLFISALAIAAYAFVSLVGVLEAGGYGTPQMRQALVMLGVAGACLAAGIATLIWDVAKRYETPPDRGGDGTRD